MVENSKTVTASICYKSVQSFWVTCLFTGQYDTKEYGTIAGVIYGLGSGDV